MLSVGLSAEQQQDAAANVAALVLRLTVPQPLLDELAKACAMRLHDKATHRPKEASDGWHAKFQGFSMAGPSTSGGPSASVGP